MKKTGLEIVEMIAKGEAPKKIKNSKSFVYEFAPNIKTYYIDGDVCLDLIQCLNEEFEIIEEPKVWKPKYDEEYWYIDNNGVIRHDYWLDVDADEFRYNIGDCFKTQGETIKAKEKAIIKAQLKRYAEEHNEEKIDWENKNQTRWSIKKMNDKVYLESNTETRVIADSFLQDMNQVYFTSREVCHQAIKEIGEDNIMKLFED